jgi:hypothetical protein
MVKQCTHSTNYSAMGKLLAAARCPWQEVQNLPFQRAKSAQDVSGSAANGRN